MSDNRATRAHIAASRGYLHEYLSTDAQLADDVADALMRNVAGKPSQFTGESHGPLTALQALRADGGSAVDEQAARLAFARRVIAARIASDPWGNDPDRTTRNWRPAPASPAFVPGDIVTDVDTGESGTVQRDFGNGIARVQWHERKRRDGRRLVPLVTDIGTVRLCA